MSCCGGNKNDRLPGPTNPNLIWPLERTAFDMNMRKNCPWCDPLPVPVVESYTPQCNSAPYYVPKYFVGNWGKALEDPYNPLSYTKFRM